MTKDKALRLALEALEDETNEKYCPAITAIKAALEAKNEPVFHKPHLDIEGPLHVVCRCPACKAQPQRKPLTVEQPEVRTGNCLRIGVCASEGHKIQPQRTWVGLTEEDLKPICNEWRIVYGAWAEDFARAIEAKLRSKND